MLTKTNKNLFIFFGPPGSGKTVQADFLASKLNMDHISWGFIFRDESYKKEYASLLQIVNDKSTHDSDRSLVINKIIEKEFKKLKSSNKSLVIDGYPRGKEEASFLIDLAKKYKYNLRSVIRINPSFESAYQRCKNRKVCSVCRRYYDDLKEPKILSTCDYDGGRLVKASFSKDELRQEFLSYNDHLDVILEYFKKNFQDVVNVSGDQGSEIVVFSNIISKLGKENNHFLIFEKKTETGLVTSYGKFRMIVYQSKIDYSFHLALVMGDVANKSSVLTRIHSSCITGDILYSRHCDCGEQLQKSLKMVSNVGVGVVLYLFQEGRGINIINKIKAYDLQRLGYDTVEANIALGLPSEMRDYAPVKDILYDLCVKSVVLLTNNPDKINKITDLGIVVDGVRQLQVESSKHNRRYLSTKRDKMNHKLSSNKRNNKL